MDKDLLETKGQGAVTIGVVFCRAEYGVSDARSTGQALGRGSGEEQAGPGVTATPAPAS